jgi:hypothetical protein
MSRPVPPSTEGRDLGALQHGHLYTASWAYLAAAECYAKALVFVAGLADQSVLLPTFDFCPVMPEFQIETFRAGTMIVNSFGQ